MKKILLIVRGNSNINILVELGPETWNNTELGDKEVTNAVNTTLERSVKAKVSTLIHVDRRGLSRPNHRRC